MDFSLIQGVVMDMDGVLWRGDQPLPGLQEFFAFLEARKLPYVLATNNSRVTQQDYVNKLARMGITARIEQIITSGTTTISYIKNHYAPDTLIHVLGGDGLRSGLTEAGYRVTGEVDQAVAAVVIGIDFELTYQKLKNATLCLHNGADFIGTNNDATFPMPDGLVPGAGSIISAVKTASGRVPLIMGKPNAPMFETAVQLLGTVPEHTLMIGDRLDTDIIGAAQVGLKTAMVLTGVSKRADVAGASHAPDGIFEGLIDLRTAWGG